MSIIPEIKRCPCCQTLNFIRVSAAIEESNFKNLKNWKLKKKFICRKCKEELGIFISNSKKSGEKIIWLNNLNIEEHYYNKLNSLEKIKNKLSKIQNKEYFTVLKDIQNLENQMRLDKTKLKIKFKIQRRGRLI